MLGSGYCSLVWVPNGFQQQTNNTSAARNNIVNGNSKLQQNNTRNQQQSSVVYNSQFFFGGHFLWNQSQPSSAIRCFNSFVRVRAVNVVNPYVVYWTAAVPPQPAVSTSASTTNFYPLTMETRYKSSGGARGSVVRGSCSRGGAGAAAAGARASLVGLAAGRRGL